MPGDFLADDLDSFFDTRDFAHSALLSTGGPGTTVPVIFDASAKIDSVTGLETLDFEFWATGKTADFASAVRGTSMLTIDGVVYVVQTLQFFADTVRILLKRQG